MNKRDYYIRCMNDPEVYMFRDWVISVFSVVKERPQLSEATYAYQIVYDPSDPDALFTAVPTTTGYQAVKIEGSDNRFPLFGAKESLDIVAGELPLQHGNVNTTYGIILGNMYFLYYPFGKKFAFVNDLIGSDFEDELYARFEDNVENIADEKPDRIYVREFILYAEACGALAGFDKLFASSGSEKALGVAPEVIKLRDELIQKHKHELSDIRVQAMIEEKVVAADKASFKGDPAEDFLISGKSFNPTRKKLYIMIGGSEGFGGAGTGSGSFIPTALRDGWRVGDLAIHANEARAGSFFRGKMTALGGTDVKNGTRMTMNAKIASKYCGTKIGMATVLNEDNYKKYIGLYVVSPKEPILLTKENIKDFFNKELMIHSPTRCNSPGDSYCEVCIGTAWGLLKNGVSAAVTNIGDVFQGHMMKRMHGSALQLAKYKWFQHLG